MEEFENLQETKLSSQPIFDGDVLHIYKDTVRLPNGKTSTREYTVHHGAVCILPLLENGDVLLERQFRYAMREVLTEIPAGKLDYIGEDPHEAALRELREETGAVASELIPLGPFYPTCAYSTEVIHMFLARGLTYLFIAHDLSVMRFICDRIAVIHKGVIVELSETEKLFAHPLHPYTRALLSAIPMPDPESEREKVLEVYDPSCHHYETDKPVWTEIEPGHFIMANQEELAEYRKQLENN